MEKAVLVRHQDAVAIVTLNRPQVLNALNHDLRDAFIAAIAAQNRDQSIRAVLVTGSTDRAFSVGLDMAVSTELNAENVED